MTPFTNFHNPLCTRFIHEKINKTSVSATETLEDGSKSLTLKFIHTVSLLCVMPQPRAARRVSMKTINVPLDAQFSWLEIKFHLFSFIRKPNLMNSCNFVCRWFRRTAHIRVTVG